MGDTGGQVIGLIGDDIEDFHTDEDKIYYISLWSEPQKKATNADIDVPQIREARDISYEYAINAVLTTLKNDVSRPKEYVKNIPVIIYKKASVPEEVMLEHEFGEIIIR